MPNPSLPQRIVSLVPSQTELLFYLGLQDRIVGITKFCVHPADKVPQVPKVGGTKKLDLGIIQSLRPDLIIGNKEENEKEQIEQLMQQYKVWISDIANLEDALEMIGTIGGLTGTDEKCQQLVKQIKTAFENLVPNGAKKVAYLIWRRPYMVAAKGTFINDMLQRCGWHNVFGHLGRYPEITPEQLHQAATELVLLSSEPYPFKEKHLHEIQAICPKAKVVLVDGEMFSWYGSRLLLAPSYFASLIDG
ncbi:MAG: helical backbone metal receptor [Chitinophagales bacterium]|nr:helical backbone metal receptor [Chitinophagales bacterium]